jgi:hypothetical protein
MGRETASGSGMVLQSGETSVSLMTGMTICFSEESINSG